MTAVATDPRTAALIADIKLANNGYLVMEYMRAPDREFVSECARTGIVTITNGTAHLPKTKPEFFKTSYPTKAFDLRQDGPDYEGSILMRQENQGLYD